MMAVDLQLGEAELIIGTPCERVFGTTTCTNNNTRATLSGDVRLSADGEVRVLPNVRQLSQITRGGVASKRIYGCSRW